MIKVIQQRNSKKEPVKRMPAIPHRITSTQGTHSQESTEQTTGNDLDMLGGLLPG